MPGKTKKTKKIRKTSKKPRKVKKAKFSKKDVRLFKDLLIKEKINLLEGMDHLTRETLNKSPREASGDLSGYSYHMADMASNVMDRDINLTLASGERELFFKIEDALKRIEEGEYGYCVACNKKISKTRLRAIPHTPYCRNCQENEEKNNKK